MARSATVIADPKVCPTCRRLWIIHTTRDARACRQASGLPAVDVVPRPPTPEERAELDRRAAERNGDEPPPARPVAVSDQPAANSNNGRRDATPHVAPRPKVDPKAARAWAIANGHPVPPRGMLARATIDAYLAATCDIAPKGFSEEVTPAPAIAPDPPPAIDVAEQLPAALRSAIAAALRTIADQLEDHADA